MIQKIAAFIEKNGLFDQYDRFLVAFSGGADSSVLLDFVCRYVSEHGGIVRAAHFNHGLRGDEARRDAEFCRAVCRRKNVGFTLGEGDTRPFAKEKGLSLEAAARELRYAFLAEEAEKDGSLILTAHNSDDNLETMLFNITRGSGLKGAGGIPPRRSNIARPLLCCTRAEILNYCKENGIPFVTDSTNLTDDCSRNVIRHKILPVLTSLNPAAIECAARTAQLLREDEEYLSAAAEALLEEAQSQAGLSCAVLAAAGAPIRTRAIAMWFAQKDVTPTYKDITEAERLIKAGGGHRTLCGIRLNACKGLLTSGDEMREISPVALEVGENWVEGRRITLKICQNPEKNNKLHFISSLNCDKITGQLVARSRQPGDYFHSGGVGKPLKKWYNEYGVPISMRNRLIVIADDSGPVFVERFGADERFAAVTGRAALDIEIG
ncbi:MAG TPA: tRNA lysidine(34) synthetase TilS [Oscillospiraceae bacterium]|nr:tRNA lysidine(34) synthetase TilS [Oscillospiraceae bacterium]HPF56896.1 tRNA lysidine(34) synthetase TilS [Clostridiales bacterium]HPK35370.1 tRNA lysidine(34) synthetase TilS [Oscillospiraceae bacterium]HPR76196.1 tRNA lysidine(34) synthetase TilS [Oscillospiraceae bacterium]